MTNQDTTNDNPYHSFSIGTGAQIKAIIKHWAHLYTSSTSEQQSTLKERLEAVRAKQIITIDTTAKNHTYWSILGSCGNHDQTIRQHDIHCTCTAFHVSSKGIGKKPCKHLYGVATWIIGPKNL